MNLMTTTIRPQVPMYLLQGAPWCAAMGLVDGLRQLGFDDALVAWPHDVAVGGQVLALRTHGGVDDGGMYVELTLAGPVEANPPTDAQALEAAVATRIARWEKDVRAGRSQAGPLADFLSELFDMMAGMGQEVRVAYPNGRIFDQGTFAGLDLWGRATIKRANGTQLEIAPEQARIVLG